jgi:ADP-ribose pyrophosphatase YjhB (NUDIX family)
MAAVSGIVNYQGNILIGKKRSDSKKFLAGQWHIPGETIEGEESDEEALKRGFLQEANLEIKVGKYLCSSITPSSKKENKWYECYSEIKEVIPGSDLEKTLWVPKKDVLNYCGLKAISLMPKEILDYFK